MKYRKIFNLFIIVILFIFIISNTVIADDTEDVYVIPIKGDINNTTYQFVKTQINEISKYSPAAIIFEIDTYGGSIDAANNIKEEILKLEVPTIALVNTKAESAGVLITISGEKVVMAKSATIGSAEPIPNTEKILSLWLSWLRSTAKLRERDPKVVMAMADKDIEIKGVIDKGRLLNLNSQEAKDLKLTDYISNDYKDILSYFDIEYGDIKTVDTDLKTKLAGFITDPYISTLLLTIGFIALLVEVFAPGFGVGGTVSFIAFALFFAGNIFGGNSSWGVIILFIVGMVLLLIEATIPGFGIPGIGGIVTIVVSIILAMGSLEKGLLSVSVAIIFTIVAGILFIKYGKKSPYLDKIILSTKQDKQQGYTSTSSKMMYLNKEGTALTFLRPAGTIEVEGDRIDAVTEGDYIEKGTSVKIIKVEGTRVIVRKI